MKSSVSSASSCSQPALSLPMNVRTVLVSTDTVGAVLGLDTETVIARAESQYKWVWDVSALGEAGEIRELRFWAREIIAPDSVGTLEPESALRLILGSRENFHAGEVGTLLCITRPTRLELQKNGALHREPGTTFYTRAALYTFLLNRLIHQQQ